ncbi:MAG TPA: hypothetical protein VFY56_03820 [Propionibacteriaceae bacterium]|nr:hypothetical protein [Propionibacteriaceae bacterium]
MSRPVVNSRPKVDQDHRHVMIFDLHSFASSTAKALPGHTRSAQEAVL